MYKSKRRGQMIKQLFFLFALMLVPAFALAETAEEKGLAIAVEKDRRDTGWGDFEQELTMILTSRREGKKLRELRSKFLEVPEDGEKSLTIFDTPKDVKGTAFLSVTHKMKDDDQWLYLPALKRIKRISSSNKTSSFMGSEFSYEDIASQEVEKYTYKWIKDEVYDGSECFVVEFYPVDKKYSGYSRMVYWIDKSEYRTLKVDYFDREGRFLKTLTLKDYKKYLDKYWRAGVMNMANHKTNKSTQLILKKQAFRTGLKDSDFNKNSLKRMR